MVMAQSSFVGPPKLSGSCLRCKRPLSDPASVLRMLGPICQAKLAAERGWDKPSSDKVDIPFDPVTGDVICQRHPDGTRSFNIPQVYAHHSPTGFEWGYAGSGPADYALNIVRVFIDIKALPPELQEPVALWKEGTIPSGIWDLHQYFKFSFVASLPYDGGTIKGSEIRAWLLSKGIPAGAIK